MSDTMRFLQEQLEDYRQRLINSDECIAKFHKENERLQIVRDEIIAAMQHPSYEEENRLRAENARLRYELTAAQEGLQTLSDALKTLLNEIQSTSGEGEK